MSHPLKIAIAADGRPNYQIAAAAEINPSYLSKIISGKVQPTAPVMDRLSAVLDRTVVELFPDMPTEASVAAERATQGLPPTVTDPEALQRVSEAVRGSDASAA